MKCRHSFVAVAIVLATAIPSIASTQSLFLPASDSRLRDDVSLLVDEGVINLPVNEWPLAREDPARPLPASSPKSFTTLRCARPSIGWLPRQRFLRTRVTGAFARYG
ncbi:MAG: hypothetical protein IPG49_16925 [Proteobacteria bacterium]|nr:hypothetical protein [Pseudomonadota bacterium]